MSIAIYEGDFDGLSGGVVCSWFISNPRGPTAFAVGFVEVAAATLITGELPKPVLVERLFSSVSSAIS